MPKEFAHTALADDEFQMTAEERLQYSLANPEAPRAMSMRAANAVTKARINYALAELAQMNIPQVQEWLQRVGEVNPRQAIELYIQLCEFTVPKLKAVEVTQNGSDTRPLAELSLSELQRMAEEANSRVVSKQ